MKILSTLLVSVSFFLTFFILGFFDTSIAHRINNEAMPASIFFTQSTTSDELRRTFENASTTKEKLKVLIVPGHEPDFGGTEFLDIKERDLNADLGLYLAQYLVEDGRYDVVMTRGKDGWNPNFESYFTANTEGIKSFVSSQKEEMAKLVGEGRIKAINGLPHNDAPTDVALRLYGINKWANENNVDIVIHIHFNDSSPRKANLPGEYNGFAIYTPEGQYSNAEASNDIAKSVFAKLSKMFPVSNLEGEDTGIVEDQELIAIGSANTVDAASLLIEYGYIYEPQFRAISVRDIILKELAFQTYIGVADFFGEASLVAGQYESTLLPYGGKINISKGSKANREVLAFQAALLNRGFYPPQDYSLNDCPVSGVFGQCTRRALNAFQEEFGIKGEDGIAGQKTRAKLRSLFDLNLVFSPTSQTL